MIVNVSNWKGDHGLGRGPLARWRRGARAPGMINPLNPPPWLHSVAFTPAPPSAGWLSRQ
jgi:hypothetical protein